jgi:hypothetical protein
MRLPRLRHWRTHPSQKKHGKFIHSAGGATFRSRFPCR